MTDRILDYIDKHFRRKSLNELSFINIVCLLLIIYIISLIVLVFSYIGLSYLNIVRFPKTLSLIFLPFLTKTGFFTFLAVFIIGFFLYINPFYYSTDPGTTKNKSLGKPKNLRWQTLKDIKKDSDFSFKNKEDTDGYPLGLIKETCVSLKPNNSTNTNIECIGASGSGKSTSIIIPNVLSALNRGSSIVIIDTKGQIYQQTLSKARNCDYNIQVFNLKNPSQSDGFNVLRYAKEQGKVDFVVDSIFESQNINKESDDSYWVLSAKALFKALINFVIEERELLIEESLIEVDDYHYGTLKRVYDLMTDWDYEEYRNQLEYLDNLFMNLSLKKPNSEARKSYLNFNTGQKKEIIGSAISNLMNKLSPFSDGDILKIFSKEDISLEDLGEKKTIVYINVNEQESLSMRLATIFITQLKNELGRRADLNPDNRLPVEVNLIIDEFGSLTRIPDFDNFISTCRSRNIHVMIAYQSVAQLYDVYGINGFRTICSNCDVHVSVGANDRETAEHFSSYFGKVSVKHKTYSKNKNGQNEIASYDFKNEELYDFSEILNEDNELIIIKIRGKDPIVLDKNKSFNYSSIINNEFKPNINNYLEDKRKFDSLYNSRNLEELSQNNSSSINELIKTFNQLM